MEDYVLWTARFILLYKAGFFLGSILTENRLWIGLKAFMALFADFITSIFCSKISSLNKKLLKKFVSGYDGNSENIVYKY